MTGGPARRAPAGQARADDGIATVWATAGVALIMIVLVFGLQLGSAIVARHRAEAAADLAALAAAGLATRGQAVACGRAGEIAAAMGGTVAECELVGWNALVAVRVEVPLTAAGGHGALGRATAGPAEGQDGAQAAL